MSDFFKVNSLSEMFRFMELPAPKHPLISFIDFSKTPFSKELPSGKVLCGFYQISFKGNERGSLKYGRESYDYQEGSLVYIAPNQLVEYASSTAIEANKGWTLFFHPDLIRSFSLDSKMKDYAFFDYQTNEALHISEKERQVLESVIAQIEMELEANLDEFSEEVIVNNLELLLNYSKRFYNRQFITRKRFSHGVVEQFTKLLENYYERKEQLEKGIPSVQYFADRLHYSPGYLNELVKKATGQNVLGHVHYKLIELAKSSLLNSDKTVSEIAFDLGFEYSQYFSRLFKKKTGFTPNEYRNAS